MSPVATRHPYIQSFAFHLTHVITKKPPKLNYGAVGGEKRKELKDHSPPSTHTPLLKGHPPLRFVGVLWFAFFSHFRWKQLNLRTDQVHFHRLAAD